MIELIDSGTAFSRRDYSFVYQVVSPILRLSYRDLEEMMAERGVQVDHSAIAHWVLHFGPMLNDLIRREMRRPNRFQGTRKPEALTSERRCPEVTRAPAFPLCGNCVRTRAAVTAGAAR